MTAFSRAQAAYDTATPEDEYQLCEWCETAFPTDDISLDDLERNTCEDCRKDIARIDRLCATPAPVLRAWDRLMRAATGVGR